VGRRPAGQPEAETSDPGQRRRLCRQPRPSQCGTGAGDHVRPTPAAHPSMGDALWAVSGRQHVNLRPYPTGGDLLRVIREQPPNVELRPQVGGAVTISMQAGSRGAGQAPTGRPTLGREPGLWSYASTGPDPKPSTPNGQAHPSGGWPNRHAQIRTVHPCTTTTDTKTRSSVLPGAVAAIVSGPASRSRDGQSVLRSG